jgi:hypothetical protein
MLLLCCLTASPEASKQSLIFYNARMAFREGKTEETLKLWLLRNSLEDLSDLVSAHDDEFLSIVWAALGKAGLCPDGLARDKLGAGLWPLALYNWVIKAMRHPISPDDVSPFRAFELGRQERWISMRDVLDQEELESVEFFRQDCWFKYQLLVDTDQSLNAHLEERKATAKILRHLLEQALIHIDKDKFQNHRVIQARIFDLNLQLTHLGKKQHRHEKRQLTTAYKERSASSAGLKKAQDGLPLYGYKADAQASGILRQSLDWSVDDWMALSPDRRLFMFHHASRLSPKDKRLTTLCLGILDRLIDKRKGAQVQDWIGQYTALVEPSVQQEIWAGSRGQKLLSLDSSTGFQEHSSLYLHRGVEFLSRGEQRDALRSIAFALRRAPQGSSGQQITNLSRRWLSFVAAQYRVNSDLITMLHNLVDRGDFNKILEDLLWQAAFEGDDSSFHTLSLEQKNRGALKTRMEMLTPLAGAKAGVFINNIRKGLKESPYFILKFLKRFVERIETQSGDIRHNHFDTLNKLDSVLAMFSKSGQIRGSLARSTAALRQRCQSILDGLAHLYGVSQKRPLGRDVALKHEIFAGSLRLAPTDTLPWPFQKAPVQAPSAFTQLTLTPVEWVNAQKTLVWGWKIGR